MALLFLLLLLPLCAGLAATANSQRDSELGRDVAIIAGLLAGALVGASAGAWFGLLKWGWHSGESWYAVFIPATFGCGTGPFLGGGLALFYARRPGRARFLTGAVASGLAALAALSLAFLFR